MIIVRTPLRLEFLGGSTDIENFYRHAPGRILNVAINKYIYVILHPRQDSKLRLMYDETEYVDHARFVTHSRTRAALSHFRIPHGLDITSLSHVSTQGSGLGASSSFTVGLVHAISAWRKEKLSARDLAELASHLEITVLHEPIGKQDQYAATYGGFNVYTFHKNGFVRVSPVTSSPDLLKKLSKHLLVFRTGGAHSASSILSHQHKRFNENFSQLRKMAALVAPAVRALGEGSWKEFGEILSREWEIKQTLTSGITNDEIETMRKKAHAAGAWGSRLSGAGGSGFLVVIAPSQRHEAIKRALADYELFPIELGVGGSQIVFLD